MKIALILTNDWEIFGDGSGDFFEIQYKPTLELIKLLKSEGATMSFMAEVFQQLKHLEFAESYPELKKITTLWEDAIINAIQNNCDVQLHIHPQWIDATYNQGKWHLDMEKSAISALNENEFRNIITNAKNYLENLIQKENPAYKCIAFRAGNYLIQPSEMPIKVLSELGIKSDLSVTKWLYSNGNYDFRTAYSNFIPWFIEPKDINLRFNQNTGILEFPIYSVKHLNSPVLRKFIPKIYYKLRYSINIETIDIKWQKTKDKVKEDRYPKKHRYYKTTEKKNLFWYLKKIISYETIQLDYDHLYPQFFVKIIEDSLKNRNAIDFAKYFEYIPLVATGHIKDIHDLENIKRILRLLNKKFGNQIEYWTITQAYNYYNKKIGVLDGLSHKSN